MTNLDSVLKSRDITLPAKVTYSQVYGFSNSHVCIWELDHKKAECRRIDAFELWCWKRLLSPLDCTEVKPVYPKGNQPWIFIGRTNAATEAPVLWSPDVKSWLTGKDPKAGGEGDNRQKGGWMSSPTQWTWVWASSGRWWRTGRRHGVAAVHGVAVSWTWLSGWTTK